MVTYQELDEEENKLKSYESQAVSAVNAPIPQRRYGSNITKQDQQDVAARRTQGQTALTQIKEQRIKIQQARQQLKDYDAVKKDYEEEQQAASVARNMWERGISWYWAKGTKEYKYLRYLYENNGSYGSYLKQKQDYYEQKKYEAESKQPGGYYVDPNTGFGYSSLNDLTKSKGYVRTALPSEISQKKLVTMPEAPNIVFGKETVKNLNVEIVKPSNGLVYNRVSNKLGSMDSWFSSYNKMGYSEGQGIVTSVSKPKGFSEKLDYRISSYRMLGGGYAFLAGLAKPIKDFGSFGFNLVTHPIKTTKETVVGAYEVSVKGLTTGFPEISEILRAQPEFSTGYALGTVGLVKAPHITNKFIDTVRVKGLTELPNTEVIAPEYFKGQTYPKISKGQTAGSLLSEFKTLLPGETKAAGYTASPKPFAKVTIAQAGSSELPGVYQAPKLSATFLRVSGEGRLFSFRFLDTLRPSATRITPLKISLPDYANKKSSKIYPAKLAKDFYNSRVVLGESYVPFIKTEKEAVIPAGTNLFRTNKRYYFSLEGRKIPIYEYETKLGNSRMPNKKTKTSSYSYLLGKEPGLVNPYSSINTASRLKPSYKISKGNSYKVVSKSLPSYSSLKKYNYSYNINSPSKKSLISSFKYPSSPSRLPSMNYQLYPPRPSTFKIPGKFYYPPYGKPPKLPSVFSTGVSDKGRKLGTKRTLGYQTIIKRFGKWKELPGLRPRGQAIKYGESSAINTLARSFKIKPTNTFVSSGNISYNPSKSLFRDYQIKGNKKIKLSNTFIQKARFSLSSFGEKEQIKTARRLKL
jgi:hypothetical protein